MARNLSRTRRRVPFQPKSLGELRTSQMITSYGCGAIVDFVHETAILAGVDSWPTAQKGDPRILHCHNLEKMLRKAYFVRPRHNERQRSVFADTLSHDIPAYRFPTMLYCPQCMRLIPEQSVAGDQRADLFCPSCNERTKLIASGFIAVCERGHLEDFPFDDWVHQGQSCEKRGSNSVPRLQLARIEDRISMNDLLIKCLDCGCVRSMQGAFATNALEKIHPCQGKRPWLATDDDEPCTAVMQSRLRSSTAIYMPANVSALSIPPWSAKAWRVVQNHFVAMEGRPPQSLRDYITSHVLEELPGLSVETLVEIYQNMQERKQMPKPANEQELYEEEYRALCHEADDRSGEFTSQECEPPEAYRDEIESVFAVHRLTEIVAMVGFTRLKGWTGSLSDPRLAPISATPLPWLPAVDMHGEGIFITLKEQRVRQWEEKNRTAYSSMWAHLAQSYIRCENASPRYVLLHTLSHLLIRALSAHCGYGAASIKERVFATWSADNALPMAGILLYTATNDADGSLGGLVDQSQPTKLSEHLNHLLEEASWCSADPLCMNSFGIHSQGVDGLNYAACHQCTLLPETSCCMRNSLLDRAALIGREADGIVGYFSEAMRSAPLPLSTTKR